ncbi:hypothetical protein [Pseudorhodoferax sp. Leaf267]|uniref:hypothetical protein n=1 Tax=Pseudorhodoferax sp. Leaf267 TaxID=1736316 RepID=UPI00350F9842
MGGKSSNQAGWGIGLAFARSVAHGHCGQLKLLRSDEEGTVFGLDLPVDARASIARGEALGY